MKKLLRFGNAIFTGFVLLVLWNSLSFYFNNFFYQSIPITSKIIILLGLFMVGLLVIKVKKYYKIISYFNKYLMIFVFISMIIWQMTLLITMPIIPIADPEHIYQIALGNTTGFLLDYISIYPNNYMILLWEKLLLVIFGTRYLIHGLILFNILFINLSVLLIYKLSNKINSLFSIFLYYLTIFFVGFSPQFLQAYTDIPAFFLATTLFFSAQYLFKNTNLGKQTVSSIFFGILLSLSYSMRAPLFIYGIAGFLVVFIFYMQNSIDNKKIKLLSLILIIVSFTTIQYSIKYSLQSQTVISYNPEKSRTLLYFIDLGLTTKGATHSELTQKVLTAEGEERNNIYIESIKNRVSKMSISDWIYHLKNKFYHISAEGMMGWETEATLKEEKIIPNRFTGKKLAKKLRNTVLVNFSNNYYNYSLFFQVIWIIIALGLVFYAFTFRTTNIFSFDLWSQIIILGGLLFLMIFEGGRSRYLIQFLPSILWIASRGYEKIFRKIQFYVD